MLHRVGFESNLNQHCPPRPPSIEVPGYPALPTLLSSFAQHSANTQPGLWDCKEERSLDGVGLGVNAGPRSLIATFGTKRALPGSPLYIVTD